MCSMVKWWPQTQWEGRCDGHQPYHKHRASLKAPLCRENPCSEMGRAESQLEAPFSEQIVRTSCSLVNRFSFSCLLFLLHHVCGTFALCFSFLFELPLFRVYMPLTGLESGVHGGLRLSHVHGSNIPSPPRRAGNASKSLSVSLKAF